MSEHAKLMSPSSAARRLACPGSHVLEALVPDTAGGAARDGTAMHEVAAMCLTEGGEPHGFIGRLFAIDGEQVEITEDMADLVKVYVDTIRARAAGNELHVEERVDFGCFVGVPAGVCFGTLDARIVQGQRGVLEVHDFKSGFHRVRAERNPQLMLYALGGLELSQLLHEIKEVELFIHQPKISDEPDSWACSVEDLLAFAHEAYKATHACKAAAECHLAEGASERFVEEYLHADEDACRFCNAKATCPALRTKVAGAVTAAADFMEDFDVLDGAELVGWKRGIATNVPSQASVQASVDALPTLHSHPLGVLMGLTDLVELWSKAVRGEVERRLLAGQAVDGWKLVQGKKGPRKWADRDAAEAQLKTMRLKVEEMYDLKVISPTTAEKLAKAKGEEKPVLGPRQWQKLQGLITQSPGSPSVAPASDNRPTLAIAPPADDFDVVEDEAPASLEALL